MPKKKNFLGGMQNYDPKTGEYEPALEGANGEKPSSFKSFNKPKSELEKANDKRLGKKTYSPTKLPEKGETVRVAKEFGDNEREFEVVEAKEGLNGITIKEKGRDGITYNVDVSQLEGYENGEPLDGKVFNKSEFEKVNEKRTGKENVKSDLTNESPKKYFKHPQVDGVWHDTGKTMEKYGNTYKVFENEEGHTWGVSDKMMSQFEEAEEPKHAFKLDKEKYPDVEETDYGFVYNVNGQSITDLKAQEKAFGGKIDENKDYGFTLTVDGDEVHYKSFDEAYQAAKNGSEPEDEKDVGKIIKYQPMKNTNGTFDYGEDVRAKKLNNGLAMETKSFTSNGQFGKGKYYKLVDIESGLSAGRVESYEEALKKSKDPEFLERLNKARENYWNQHPERRRTPTDPEVIKTAKKIKSSGDEYTYQMLDRLKSDVDYVFGRGGKGAIGRLWYDGNPTNHIALMKELYKGLKEKPEWLTMEQINEYEKKFKELED